MDPTLSAFLTSWDPRIEVLFLLAIAGTTYILGWWRLRSRTRHHVVRSRWNVAARWRPISYLAGLTILGVALLSPIDVLASQLFTMHMVQHILLVMIIPPLLLLANPLPYVMWGLPSTFRRPVGQALGRKSPVRQTLEIVSKPGWVWLAFVVLYLGWHDPNAYNLALQSAFAHDLEHVTFFLVSMLFWWHVIGAGPRLHRKMPPLARAGYVLLAVPPNMIAGIAIAFASQTIYTYYEAMPRLLGLSVLDDQRIGGVIMWVPGSMMYMVAALVLVSRWLQREERKPPLPQSAWASDDSLIAPGWEK